jgi:carboxypeptidase family protein
MRKASRVGALVVAAAVGGLTAACDNGPRHNPAGPTPGAQPFAVAVEINGPASIPPGQSAQFTAIVRLNDGTSQAPTSVRWSSHTGSLRVDASGLVTARPQTGEDILSAEATSSAGVTRGSREILILPDGTYRMVGIVTESGSQATPIVGARVEVTTGTPLVAVTDWDGRYRLYGVPGVGDVRVIRDGYQPHVQSFQLAEHVTQNFQLQLSGMRLDLAGPYTLAIDVACPTSTPVPPDLRHLSYAAFLTQTGATLEVVLTESPRFRLNGVGRGDRFSGRVDAAGATFNLAGFSDTYYYYGPGHTPGYANLVERLADGTYLVVAGTAVTRSLRAGLSGDLKGGVAHYDSRFLSIPLLSSAAGYCYSDAHRFTLSPR